VRGPGVRILSRTVEFIVTATAICSLGHGLRLTVVLRLTASVRGR